MVYEAGVEMLAFLIVAIVGHVALMFAIVAGMFLCVPKDQE
jgi:hypothetical protein